jgi:hypothetical protein
MTFRFKLCAATYRAAGIMVSLRRHPAQPQLWVRAGFAVGKVIGSGAALSASES